jgi:SPP1 gp7 family putative phage head morphogenesis protein
MVATPEATAVRFEEAISFLRRRLALPADRWLELVREMDAAATDRARGMSDALVKAILEAVLNAVAQGDTFETFLADYDAAVRRHGFAAEGDVETRNRAQLAFRIMTAQAYAAGRWRQIQRLKAVRPYLRYVHVDPALTQRWSREEHAAWHGLVLPVDDPWWLTHYPPNGWNCRCYVQSLSPRDMERFGWSVSAAPPERTVIKFVRGRPVETPAGVDPGFGFNVGVVGLRSIATP